jgi:beta-glucanase (GH16 family)
LAPTPFPSAGPASVCLNNALYTTSFAQQFSDVNSWRANNGTGGQWFTGYQWGRTNVSAGDAAFYIDKSLDLPGTPGYDPFGISNSGLLTIEAQPVGSIPGLLPSQIDNSQYVSGLISTGGQNINGDPATTFTQRYGYYEVMVQLPAGQGIWPSFWMLDTYTRAEVDVFEFLGQNTTQIYQSIHYFNGTGQSIPYTLGFNPTAGLHRYGVLISPTNDVYYVDGVPTQSYPDASQNAFYFMVSLQVGGKNSGNFPGPPNNTTPWPAVMYLQYFHAYAPTTSSCTSQSIRSALREKHRQ